MDSIGNKKRNTFCINGIICNQSNPRNYNYKLTYNNPSLTYASPSDACLNLSFTCYNLSFSCVSLSVAGHSFSLATPSLRLFLSPASNTFAHNSLILYNKKGVLLSKNKILLNTTLNRKPRDNACLVSTLTPKYVELIPKPVIRKPYPETLNQQPI